MIELLFGTGNPGKIALMRKYLADMPIILLGLKDIAIDWPDPDETGRFPLENARQKAEAYFRVYGKSVFSCDSGLFIDELPEDEQPGVHVRNVDGKRLSDTQMTAHYVNIAKRFGGKCTAQYRNAICLILEDGSRYELDGPEISGNKFYLTAQAKEQKEEGFPLDCMSINKESGIYFCDEEEQFPCDEERNGFRCFFSRALGID